MFASALLGVMGGAFALIHLPALYQCAGEGGHGFGADRTFAPLVDVFRCQCQLHVGGCDGKPPASIGQCFQQLGVFLF
ncbi:MAG: hypothetical protein DSZ00_08295 [Gammaproteobacteria bacterium]|nr:MAG: hypothetical protein DSZ00_08295 [Gammaproteobacteria bacterium]